MPMFDTSSEEPKFVVTAKESEQDGEVKWSDKENTMRQAIGEIRPGLTTHFVTAGSWSCYELLKYVLKITGPAAVDAFTWNISMPAVTQIMAMQRDGMWTSFRILVHSAMKRYTAEALSVLQTKVDKVVLYPNHAKGFLIRNDKWTVRVVSSANFSNNANIEAGVITCSPEIYWMHRKWLDKFFEKKELLSSTRIKNHELQEQAIDTAKSLFVIRGLPGSGKSTLAASIADAVFSNDDYFTDLEGHYKFDMANLPRAKSECFSRVRQAMEDGVERIAVANTFVHEDGIIEYQQLATLYHYRCHVLTVENRHCGHNIHNVQESRIDRMRKEFKVRL